MKLIKNMSGKGSTINIKTFKNNFSTGTQIRMKRLKSLQK